jgi:hypothetical protein
MLTTADKPDAPAAIRVDLGVIFVSLDVSKSNRDLLRLFRLAPPATALPSSTSLRPCGCRQRLQHRFRLRITRSVAASQGQRLCNDWQ